MSFPTLSRRPLKGHVTYLTTDKSFTAENGSRLSWGNGYSSKYKVTITYDKLPTADRDLLMSHFEDVRTADSFTWTDQLGLLGTVNATYTMKYSKPLAFEFFITGYWTFESIEMEQV